MNSDLTAHNAGWSVERNISRCFVIVEEGCIFVGKSVIKLVKRGTEEMTTAERLYNTAKELPEPVVAEILDFAEFLRKKRVARDVTVSKWLPLFLCLTECQVCLTVRHFAATMK